MSTIYVCDKECLSQNNIFIPEGSLWRKVDNHQDTSIVELHSLTGAANSGYVRLTTEQVSTHFSKRAETGGSAVQWTS